MNCLGSRSFEDEKWGAYSFLTYREVAKLVDDFGSGLVSLGLKPGDALGNDFGRMKSNRVHFSCSRVLLF